MGRSVRQAAYVVFVGRIPGVYSNWEECKEQVHCFSGGKQRGYRSRGLAEQAWEQHAQQRDQTPKRKFLAETSPCEATNTDYPHSAERASIAAMQQAMEKDMKLIREVIEISDDEEVEQKLARKPVPTKKPEATAKVPKKEAESITMKEEDEKSAPTNSTVTDSILEKQPNFISLVDDKSDKETPTSTPKKGLKEEKKIVLTDAQNHVVKLAVAGNNIFLTGAAGSGKTATLKEILRLLRKKYHDQEDTMHPAIQIVAPTGIAALPLNGKTTYSFAGWSPDSPKKTFKELVESATKRVRTTMDHVAVLIIEEISMVENGFLERLNMYMQALLDDKRPFGGKQILFVGDFHQLPPVKPFENCILCGEPTEMNAGDESRYCDTALCRNEGIVYQEGDKWAFKAPVWKLLNLRHVKLEQIHRQKDTSFQTMLNKIRNGQALEDSEWSQLTAVKHHSSPPMRLMSLIRSVDGVNTRELANIRSAEKGWAAYDEGHVLHDSEDHPCPPQVRRDLDTYLRSLDDGSFTTNLKLKIGAKIVLLSNLDLKGGLVNGTQGTVLQFVDTEGWAEKMCGEWSKEKIAKINIFQKRAGFCCPIVRFANGKIKTIFPEYMASLRGHSTRRCLVSRTQIPLKLAWALSIHKSQGMTLENVVVSRKHLFANGQLYVGLSRATTIEGLTVTDYTKEQFTVESADDDVVKFYTETAWEDLGSSNISG